MRENVLNASVPLTLDGREFVLRYRAYAFIVYCEQTGRDLLTDMQEMGQAVTGAQETGAPVPVGRMFTLVRDLLWAGFADAHPDVKRDDVARMLDLAHLMPVMESILKALRLTMPEGAERPTEAMPANGNGRDSAPQDGRGSGLSSETAAESLQENSYVALCGTSAT